MSVARVVRIPVPASTTGETLEADFHPAAAPGAPVIIMAHGMGAERTFGLEPVVQSFRSAGYAVLVLDYRGFGGSDGVPRLLVNASRQRADIEAALDFAAGLPGVDTDRRVLWGVSFGGGHVLAVAARRPEVSAVVAMVPHVDGIASALRYPLRRLPQALLYGVRDLLRAVRSAPPIRVPVVSRDGFAVLPGRDAWEGYMDLLPPGLPDPTGEGWDGRVPARIFLTVIADRPGQAARQIRRPVLVQAAENDALIPFSALRRTARRIPQVRFESYPMDHFGPYREPWATRLRQGQLDFLRQTVGEPGGR